MISGTYDPRCETFRFVGEMIRFVFAVFGLIGARNEKSRLLALPSSREGRRPA
jgi:hypothetical protein